MKRLLLVLLFTLTAWLAVSVQLRGTVIAIVDGDNFTLLTAQNQQVKIRLHGIDCPEKKRFYSNNLTGYTSSPVLASRL